MTAASRFANAQMTADEQVAFAWANRDHFEDVRRHNLEVVSQRRRGDWSGQYRNAWAELARERASAGSATAEGRRENPENNGVSA